MPTTGQLVLLCIAIAFFVIGGIVSLSRLRWERSWSRLAAKACFWSGVSTAVAVLVWHSANRRDWIPLDDNFEAFIWLGVMLGLFVMYVQRTRPIGGLDWFIMPLVIVLLSFAAVFGSARPQAYLRGTWDWVHRISSFGGAIGFAIAGAVGAMYLVAHHRLRTKLISPGPKFASLERLERITLESASLGFALLTLGAITGTVQMLFEHRDTSLAKIILTACCMLIFAVVLHSPMNPSFRGRRTAILSVIGLALLVCVLIVAELAPRAGRAS